MADKETLRLYSVDDSFIKDLRDNVDGHVFANIDPNYDHSRKYLGVVLKINGFSYYAPLSSAKKSDYMLSYTFPVPYSRSAFKTSNRGKEK